MRHFYIEEKLYKANPLFVFDCSLVELSRFLKRKFGIDEDLSDLEGATGSVLNFKDKPFRVLWMESFTDTPEGYGLLAHEVDHLTTRICTDKGIHYPIPNHENGEVGDEPHAYMVDFFVREFLSKV